MPPENVTPDIWFPNLGIYFDNVPQFLIGDDPNASIIYISNFPMNIYLYAIMIIIGIAAAYFLAIWYVKKSGQKWEDYFDLLLLGVPMAFLGLRLYYLAFNWSDFEGQNFFSAFFDLRSGGLAIYGGIIGAVIAALIIGMVKNIPFATLADTGAPSMLLGQVIGRFGNFFNREIFGGYTDGLFAMRIQLEQTRFLNQELMDTAVVYAQGINYLQVHPTFLYEAVFNLLLMIGLIVYRPHKKFNGEIVLLYFLGYGIIRFIIEGIRTDQMIFFNTGIPLNQITAVIFAVISAGLIVRGHIKAKATKPPRRKM